MQWNFQVAFQIETVFCFNEFNGFVLFHRFDVNGLFEYKRNDTKNDVWGTLTAVYCI